MTEVMGTQFVWQPDATLVYYHPVTRERISPEKFQSIVAQRAKRLGSSKVNQIEGVTEDEVAAAIAAVLAGHEIPAGISQQEAVAELLMKLPDPPEPEAAREAARMVLEADGQT
jgi:hypothetical protein